MIGPGRHVAAAEVAAHYDDLDRFYREVWGEHVHHGLWLRRGEGRRAAAENLVALVAERAGVGPGDRVCDVGCGYGATARWLARERGAVVTALTISAAQASRAVAGGAGDGAVTVLLRDWLDNALPGAAFDAVVAIESTEHMAERERWAAEMRRVLVPGGRAVICAWLAAPGAAGWRRSRLLEPICREGRLAALATAAETVRLLEAAGLVVERAEDLTHGVARTWSVCLERLAAELVLHRRYRAFLLDRRNGNRVFAWTLLRMRAAYAVGALRYGVFTARRPR